MTLNQSALLELTEAMRILLHTILQALVDTEATEHIGAGMHEQNDTRTTQRNGTRTKVVSTTSGDLSVKIAKTRTGSFFPSLLRPRRRIDVALHAVVIEAYVHGVSTRKVDDLVTTMGAEAGISKSEVSRICADLDVEVAVTAAARSSVAQSGIRRPRTGGWIRSNWRACRSLPRFAWWLMMGRLACGHTLSCRYADDNGMRNLVIVALTDAGRRIDEVARVFGLAATHVSILRGRAKRDGSAGLVKRRGRPRKFSDRQVARAQAGLPQTRAHDRLDWPFDVRKRRAGVKGSCYYRIRRARSAQPVGLGGEVEEPWGLGEPC